MKIKWTGYKSETVHDGLCKDGMIIEDNSIGKAEALDIETIRKIVTLKWNYPWGGKQGGEKIEQHRAPDNFGVISKAEAFHQGRPAQTGVGGGRPAPVMHQQQGDDDSAEG